MFNRFLFYLKFTNGQRKGVLSLFFVIIMLQLLYWFGGSTVENHVSEEAKQWLRLQSDVDALKAEKEKDRKQFPFNPNYITDYRGYKLGMSVTEIDRLHAFRKNNHFVNSAEEFQKVTGVSDALLHKIAPYFKFPDWVAEKNKTKFYAQGQAFNESGFFKNKANKILDINLATKEDLMKIHGIGDVISDRIITRRTVLNGFVGMEQLDEIWGLSPEVVLSLRRNFKIGSIPDVKKININSASIKELSRFPYFTFQVSKNIVIYRSMNGDLKIEDLTNVKDFPVDKLKIIALYLEF
jgi:DNA uptake protein ComE-like DNA-binding protein